MTFYTIKIIFKIRESKKVLPKGRAYDVQYSGR